MKLKTIINSLLVSLLLALCVSSHGYAMTLQETGKSITIPMTQWVTLTNEFKELKADLIQCRTDLTKIKKPSTELLNELSEAEKMLKSLQEELTKQKEDLMMLSSEVNELKTLSETLKKQIDKERRVHRRQIWQNRIWCILIGAGIGAVASR